VRSVPARETQSLKEVVEGCKTFVKLAESYGDIVIRQT